MQNPGYRFSYLPCCEMCGELSDNHKILGQRLNMSQGLRPRRLKGITTTVVQCKGCGLIYVNPQPVPLNIQDHYGVPPENYWKEEYFKVDPMYFSHQIETFKRLTTFEKGMTALDIGAGLGKCMVSLKQAEFEAYGIEPSKSFHGKAIREMNIPPDRLRLGMLEDCEYDENFFNFITFGAVLEHLYDPSASILKAMRWLKPGGLMHVEVPSASYLISRLINLYYTMTGTPYVTNTSPMHAPYHLYEFTLHSFIRLAERSKAFEVIDHQRFVCSADPFPSFAQHALKQLMRVSNTGMQLSVWLKKNNVN
jgi:2-polyprenyl-3-methyl-5-hydroxy-6-metoxy-1,4-benzoquinol methylase